VRTLDWDGLEGDSVFDAEYSDWRDVTARGFVSTPCIRSNGMKVADLKLASVVANPAFGARDLQHSAKSCGQCGEAGARKRDAVSMDHPPPSWVSIRFRAMSRTMSTSLRLDDIARCQPDPGGTHNTIFIARTTI